MVLSHKLIKYIQNNLKIKESFMPNEILIEVAYALPQKQLIIPIKVKQGVTAEEAIQLSGITKKFPEIDLEVNQIGIFGKLTQLDHVMRERDRIEIYRPLIADPKEIRRQRAAEGKVMKKGGDSA
jgi:putative ubiquitin-RnfH superfamily antitoxin RatB of RatAB toxin-antitoxin module